MRDTLFKMFGSVRLVQEVSRSSSPTAQTESPPPDNHHPPITDETPLDPPTPDDALFAETPMQRSRTAPVPLPSYPVSLASYLPGMPFHVHAHPKSPNWILGLPSQPKPKRKHARKNSLYSVRHHHHHKKQPSAGQIIVAKAVVAPSKTNTPLLTFGDKVKPKSQKLLCLWPLPVITRYIIGISLLVSALAFLGLFHLKCSSPSFVIHRLEVVNLLLSPFLFTGSLHTFFLFAWNILILGLFEESLAHMLGGTRRFVKVLVGIILSVCMTRQGIGYLFSKSTGFAVPTLFFSDSLHECNQGNKQKKNNVLAMW